MPRDSDMDFCRNCRRPIREYFILRCPHCGALYPKTQWFSGAVSKGVIGNIVFLLVVLFIFILWITGNLPK